MREKKERSAARASMAHAFAFAGIVCAACGGESSSDGGDVDDIGVDQAALEQRAYVVSLESDELTVIDLQKLEIIAQVPTGGVENHMAELNADLTKIYIDSSHTDEAVVVDTRKLEVIDRIEVGKHPSHLSLHPDTGLLAIMLEGDDAVTFLDTEKDRIVKTLPGFMTPHFMRFSRDGKWGYVANIGAHHLTRVRMNTLEIEDHIPLDGFAVGTVAENEGGFADAQIDRSGTLHAAHAATGRVLIYDTISGQKLAETKVGKLPWIAYAEHPFANVSMKHLVPNFGDRTVSLISDRKVLATVDGDQESYGVNYSSLVPTRAFVMNRMREDIAVVDVEEGDILDRIDVGGNTETASTTADGKYIVAAVSGANRVVVIDAKTQTIKKIFENVGRYPWSVTIPGGQNYCH